MILIMAILLIFNVFNSTLNDNYSNESGGGIVLSTGTYSNASINVTILNSDLNANSASYSGSNGGGIYNNGNTTLIDSNVNNNADNGNLTLNNNNLGGNGDLKLLIMVLLMAVVIFWMEVLV